MMKYVKYIRLFMFLGTGVLALLLGTAIGQAKSKSVIYRSSIQRSKFVSSYAGRFMDRAAKNKKYGFIWKMGLQNESFATSNESSQIVGFNIGSKLRWKLLDNLDFNSGLRLNLESGFSQSVFGDLEPANRIRVSSAYIRWSPVRGISLKGGMLSQKKWSNPLFLNSFAFPGVQESVSWLTKTKRPFRVELSAQQLIPTASTLSTRISEKEEVPQLFTETLSLYWQPVKWGWLKSNVSLFDFNRLPHQVAFESQKYGNSVLNGGPTTAEFAFDFKGWNTQQIVEFRVGPRFSTQIQWDVFKNTAAKETFNDSQAVSISVAYDFGTWLIQPKVAQFFVESDATPAFYNSHLLGHTNRQGTSYALGIEFKKLGFRVLTSYVESKTLNSNFFQQDQNYFLVQVGTTYEAI